MKLKKILYVIAGCIAVGLGAVGAVLPLLPSFPFLLLAAFCFARSSERLHKWFIDTKLYKNNLESYVKGQGMERSSPVLTAKKPLQIVEGNRLLLQPCHHLLIGVHLLCDILHVGGKASGAAGHAGDSQSALIDGFCDGADGVCYA